MIGAILIDDVNKERKNWFFIHAYYNEKTFFIEGLFYLFNFVIFLSNKVINSFGIGAVKVNNFLVIG